jgi:pimeloyl-ACP methyl ester carboxylesterase
MDLLTSDEEAYDSQTGVLRFDIEFLARRLIEATHWLMIHPQTAPLSVGFFGASTGAAAALVAAAELPDLIEAVVSRGGRPDLAGEALRQVFAPTLLIVGSTDLVVLELNQKALAELAGEKKLEIVPGAGHLFEEASALEAVAQLAKNWFVFHLGLANKRRRAA